MLLQLIRMGFAGCGREPPTGKVVLRHPKDDYWIVQTLSSDRYCPVAPEFLSGVPIRYVYQASDLSSAQQSAPAQEELARLRAVRDRIAAELDAAKAAQPG